MDIPQESHESGLIHISKKDSPSPPSVSAHSSTQGLGPTYTINIEKSLTNSSVWEDITKTRLGPMEKMLTWTGR